MRKKTKYILSIGALSVGIIVCLGIFVFINYFDTPFDNRVFDRELWIRNYDNYHPDNPRAEMIYDLTKNHLRAGMTKGEVIKLLGKPDRRNKRHFISYLIGMQGFVADPGQLEFELNDENRVIKFYLVER